MPLISVIIPCYNEGSNIEHCCKEIREAVLPLKAEYDIDLEILLVDDGSTDSTAEKARELSERDGRVKFLIFSRNFGKEAAIFAGLSHARGDYICIMDADLQDPPSMISAMFKKLKGENLDCVAARRLSRKGEPLIRSLFARTFYWLISRISDTKMQDGARDFRIFTRKVADAILSVTEYNRFSKGLFIWVGFRTEWVEYPYAERFSGITKWSFLKLLKYSFEGIIAYSTLPLAISSFAGMLFCFISIVMAIYYALKALIYGDPVTGFPTLICIILLVGGLQLFCMGILGQYLAKTYLEVKNRPKFIIAYTNIKDKIP
ncbi:MAG: glycosyltransferase family 2 protein [Deferribacteraceae bacterium]|jgi:glycosyltransferase involved in cell wall biosynthesis|nr:glycosyltransferase family 2 protein [Deferribacteraceae bacterium]